MDPVVCPTLDQIVKARARIAGAVLRTPLIRLNVEDAAAEIYLKLENLQPIGSFKLRGAGNAMASAPAEALARGVYTASAGNMAQGVAWNARRMGVPCRVIVPTHAPRTKIEAIRRLGAEIVAVPFDAWWQVIESHAFPGAEGLFIHPVSDAAVIAGNATVGLEILEDLPDVTTIVVPYGGGGLSAGIAAAVRGMGRDVPVLGAEVETAAPLSASLAAGRAMEVAHQPSFVDGIGGKSVLPEMWPLVRDLLDGAVVTTLAGVAEAIRLLATRNRVIAEGAGGAAVAAALSGEAGAGKVVCVVSGGNIDATTFCRILSGEVP